MDDDVQSKGRRHRRVWRRVMIGLAVCAVVLIVFHRPILLAIGRKIALNYAAKQNLKADFRVEGNPFGSVTFQILQTGAGQKNGNHVRS